MEPGLHGRRQEPEGSGFTDAPVSLQSEEASFRARSLLGGGDWVNVVCLILSWCGTQPDPTANNGEFEPYSNLADLWSHASYVPNCSAGDREADNKPVLKYKLMKICFLIFKTLVTVYVNHIRPKPSYNPLGCL